MTPPGIQLVLMVELKRWLHEYIWLRLCMRKVFSTCVIFFIYSNPIDEQQKKKTVELDKRGHDAQTLKIVGRVGSFRAPWVCYQFIPEDAFSWIFHWFFLSPIKLCGYCENTRGGNRVGVDRIMRLLAGLLLRAKVHWRWFFLPLSWDNI